MTSFYIIKVGTDMQLVVFVSLSSLVQGSILSHRKYSILFDTNALTETVLRNDTGNIRCNVTASEAHMVYSMNR